MLQKVEVTDTGETLIAGDRWTRSNSTSSRADEGGGKKPARAPGSARHHKASLQTARSFGARSRDDPRAHGSRRQRQARHAGRPQGERHCRPADPGGTGAIMNSLREMRSTRRPHHGGARGSRRQARRQQQRRLCRPPNDPTRNLNIGPPIGRPFYCGLAERIDDRHTGHLAAVRQVFREKLGAASACAAATIAASQYDSPSAP